MRIAVNVNDDGTASVAVAGEITVKDYRQLTETIGMLAQQSPPPSRVALNLEQVSYVDSVGLGSLIRIFTMLKKVGCQLVLQRPTAGIRDSLSLAKLDQILPIE